MLLVARIGVGIPGVKLSRSPGVYFLKGRHTFAPSHKDRDHE